ncbi:50S ribosomal protein L22 [Candidatus Hepatincolaceae symbiont of Richtersius coronifer]
MAVSKNVKEAKAILRNVRVSPFKLNLVAQSIRGLSCQEALNQLTFSHKAIAFDVKKTLLSAIANAQNNHDMDVDKLYVKLSSVGKAIVMKRFHARAKGRGVRIIKPFSHLFITLSEKGETV